MHWFLNIVKKLKTSQIWTLPTECNTQNICGAEYLIDSERAGKENISPHNKVSDGNNSFRTFKMFICLPCSYADDMNYTYPGNENLYFFHNVYYNKTIIRQSKSDNHWIINQTPATWCLTKYYFVNVKCIEINHCCLL